MAQTKIKVGTLSYNGTTFIHLLPSFYIVRKKDLYTWSYSFNIVFLLYAIGLQIESNMYESELFKYENGN